MDWNESITLYPDTVMRVKNPKCMNCYLYPHRQLYSTMVNFDKAVLGFLNYEKIGIVYK